MALQTAWYIAPYKRKRNKFSADRIIPIRYCAMDDYTQQIFAEGGKWAEAEVLGNRAIVKVKASVSTLAILDGVFKRIPKDKLDDTLSSLSAEAKNTLKNEVLDMGYSLQEIDAKLPNPIGTYSLRDVLKLMATRRLKPRYDKDNDVVICDGEEQPVRDLDEIDEVIK